MITNWDYGHYGHYGNYGHYGHYGLYYWSYLDELRVIRSFNDILQKVSWIITMVTLNTMVPTMVLLVQW